MSYSLFSPPYSLLLSNGIKQCNQGVKMILYTKRNFSSEFDVPGLTLNFPTFLILSSERKMGNHDTCYRCHRYVKINIILSLTTYTNKVYFNTHIKINFVGIGCKRKYYFYFAKMQYVTYIIWWIKLNVDYLCPPLPH